MDSETQLIGYDGVLHFGLSVPTKVILVETRRINKSWMSLLKMASFSPVKVARWVHMQNKHISGFFMLSSC